jgi:kinesin family member C1
MTRRQLHNTIQELKGNIRVMTRIRPLIAEDGSNASTGAIECSEDGKKLKITSQSGTTGNSTSSSSSNNELQKHSFTFDHVFSPMSKQEDVYAEVEAMVQSSLDGYHCCLFSYGQTGAGKRSV